MSDETAPVLAGKRLDPMDWIAIGLFCGGALAVATGLLPESQARATVSRILPLLIFLGSVIVLAELAARAELFDVIAIRVTTLSRGRNVALFLSVFCLAALTTMVLNLDTTAVLLTPVLIATARRARVPVLPLAMTAVWLANTASLLLPVSNLTNLLAANRIGLQPAAFAARMALPQLAALTAAGTCLWIFYWRRNPAAYQIPPPHEPHDRSLFWAAAVCVLAFVICIVGGVSITIAAGASAVALAVAVAVRDRRQLTWGLLPWRLLVFVTGLFLVVDTAGRHGLSALMSQLIGTDGGASGVVRAASVGAVSSNVLNNLPTYAAGEAVIPVGNHDQLIGLLIGTNVGPLVIPWASLATMLWAERCRSAGVPIAWPRFLATSAVTALVALVASVAALLVTR
jgi:arsenical pump membrane protein